MTSPAQQWWQHVVSDEEKGLRADRLLSVYFGQLSRTRLQGLIEAGHFLVDQNPVTRPAFRMAPGQQLAFRVPPPEPSDVAAQNIPLDFLYEDEDVVVLNKPAGISVHPSGGERDGTLVNALLYHLSDLSGIGGQLRPGIVHRLDKPTSGVLVVAKSDRAHRNLARAFKRREVSKIYYALAVGTPRPLAGLWDLPIGRHRVHRTRMSVQPDGRAAQTRYQVVRSGQGLSWVRLAPVTGRTHQLRVHLAHHGHPIVLDTTYGYDDGSWCLPALRPALRAVSGVCLHAARLSFPHPVRQQRLDFSARLPAELAALVDAVFPDWRASPLVEETDI